MSKFKFNIEDKYKQLAGFHITQSKIDKNNYLRISESEYFLFKEYLDHPKKILELGCGLGRMSIYLDNILPYLYDRYFILADSTNDEQDKKHRIGWQQNGGVFYNDMRLTESFCKEHGLIRFELLDLKKDSLKRLSDIDLVMSFLSVGYHYPIELYMETLLNITTDNCIMVFGVRRHHNRYTEIYFKQYFKTIVFKRNLLSFKESKKNFVEDILILKDKK